MQALQSFPTGAVKSISLALSRRVGTFLVLVVAALLLTACPNKQLGFQGRLLDANGNPLNGQYDMVFRLWKSATSTDSDDLEYTFTQNDVQVTNGLFDLPIGTSGITPNEGIDPAIFTQALYLEIEIEGEVLSPRQKLNGAPYAMTLAGGSVIISLHEGDGAGGSDETDINYATLSVVAAGAKGTALGINANQGDLIRACTGVLGGTNTRSCSDLRFRVQNNGNVTADGSITGGGADFAEYISLAEEPSTVVAAGHAYEPGDVMVISPTEDRAVELASEPYSTAVIGVYSTDPVVLGGGRYLDDEGSTDMLPVGIVGIVPVKVSAENGAIHRGDLLTTSSTPGHAMLAADHVPGAILGKAMGELESGTGVIEVVLLLQ